MFQNPEKLIVQKNNVNDISIQNEVDTKKGFLLQIYSTDLNVNLESIYNLGNPFTIPS